MVDAVVGGSQDSQALQVDRLNAFEAFARQVVFYWVIECLLRANSDKFAQCWCCLEVWRKEGRARLMRCCRP